MEGNGNALLPTVYPCLGEKSIKEYGKATPYATRKNAERVVAFGDSLSVWPVEETGTCSNSALRGVTFVALQIRLKVGVNKVCGRKNRSVGLLR